MIFLIRLFIRFSAFRRNNLHQIQIHCSACADFKLSIGMDPMRSSRVDPMYPPPYSGEQPPKYNWYTTYPYNYSEGAYPQQLGVAYYPQPAYLPQMQQQQQQAAVVIIEQQQQRAYVSRPYISFTGPIVLSCFVFWMCGWLFGMIAFILASKNHSSVIIGYLT